MGVSFHQIDRRFEGRESATNNPRRHCDLPAEPNLNVSVRKRYLLICVSRNRRARQFHLG